MWIGPPPRGVTQDKNPMCDTCLTVTGRALYSLRNPFHPSVRPRAGRDALKDDSHVVALRTDRQDAPDRAQGRAAWNRKTKRRFLPNLLNVTLMSDSLGRSVRLRISANALKTVDHRGGLDAFLLKAKDGELSARVLDLKREVVKKRVAAA